MLTLENVCWKPDGRDAVLKGIDLQLKPGKLTVVTGPNGGGKTSLAKVIAGLNQVSSGRISLGDIDITEKDITAMLFSSRSDLRGLPCVLFLIWQQAETLAMKMSVS